MPCVRVATFRPNPHVLTVAIPIETGGSEWSGVVTRGPGTPVGQAVVTGRLGGAPRVAPLLSTCTDRGLIVLVEDRLMDIAVLTPEGTSWWHREVEGSADELPAFSTRIGDYGDAGVDDAPLLVPW